MSFTLFVRCQAGFGHWSPAFAVFGIIRNTLPYIIPVSSPKSISEANKTAMPTEMKYIGCIYDIAYVCRVQVLVDEKWKEDDWTIDDDEKGRSTNGNVWEMNGVHVCMRGYARKHGYGWEIVFRSFSQKILFAWHGKVRTTDDRRCGRYLIRPNRQQQKMHWFQFAFFLFFIQPPRSVVLCFLYFLSTLFSCVASSLLADAIFRFCILCYISTHTHARSRFTKTVFDS